MKNDLLLILMLSPEGTSKFPSNFCLLRKFCKFSRVVLFISNSAEVNHGLPFLQLASPTFCK